MEVRADLGDGNHLERGWGKRKMKKRGKGMRFVIFTATKRKEKKKKNG